MKSKRSVPVNYSITLLKVPLLCLFRATCHSSCPISRSLISSSHCVRLKAAMLMLLIHFLIIFFTLSKTFVFFKRIFVWWRWRWYNNDSHTLVRDRAHTPVTCGYFHFGGFTSSTYIHVTFPFSHLLVLNFPERCFLVCSCEKTSPVRGNLFFLLLCVAIITPVCI